MARKIFKYRGKTISELKEMRETDFVLLLPTKQRRSYAKGYTEEENIFIKLIKGGKNNIKTHCRTIIVLPYMVGKTVFIHNGKSFEKMLFTEDMLGHYFGEFALTRKRLQHSSPGVGATRSKQGVSK